MLSSVLICQTAGGIKDKLMMSHFSIFKEVSLNVYHIKQAPLVLWLRKGLFLSEALLVLNWMNLMLRALN